MVACTHHALRTRIADGVTKQALSRSVARSTACRMRSMVGRESIDERATPRRRCNTYALPACTGAVYSNRPRSSHDGLICEQLRRERPHGGAGLRLHTTVRNRAVSSRPRMPDRPSLITSPRRPAACDWLAPRPWGPDPFVQTAPLVARPHACRRERAYDSCAFALRNVREGR